MKLSKYRFIIKPQEELILPPYKGSTFRGAFGHSFRRAVCVEKGKECVQCELRCKCIYSYVFETSITKEMKNDAGSREEDAPHPFIIEPCLEERQQYGINDRLDFHLILIGHAVDYIPYFIFAFEEMGRIGIGKNNEKYSLEKVFSLYKNREILIYDGESHFRDNYQVIDSAELVNEATQLDGRKVTLCFLTPARIKYNGRFTMNMNFEIIIRNLLRRLSGLAAIHCDEIWELDWKGLIERAKEVKTVRSDLEWYDWERYSKRQDTKMKMGGFVGEITFEGELSEFMPFIKLGEYFHIGKGTVFGLGKYEIAGE